MENIMTWLIEKLKTFRKEDSGVAALEFALIAPILLLLFLGTIEVSLAVAVDRKVSRISSSIADLITRTDATNISPTELNEFIGIADRIMFPYQDDVSIAIVAVDVVGGAGRVRWRHTTGSASAPNPGQPFSVPASIRTDGSFLIAAEVSTDHAPAVGFINFDDGKISFDGASIELSEQMFLRPRRAPASGINCTSCS